MPKNSARSKGAETRRAIIRQAAPIFNRKGYEGAAMSDLMSATGLEKGGIYRHFKNKQQLAAEAFDYAWDIAFQLRTRDTERIANSVDRLQQWVRNFRERRDGLVPGGCPLLNTAVDADNGNAVLRRKAERALGGWMDRLREIVAQGKGAGEIRAAVNADDVAATIISTLEGSLMISRLQRSERAIEHGCRHLARYLESEVRAAKSPGNAERS
jgi:TetR/AcrR family transcriptional repressor of nem operon